MRPPAEYVQYARIDGTCRGLRSGEGLIQPSPNPRDERETRRHDVLEALLRITRRDGLDAVSVRTVAAEAGTSMGFVQRQFPTKDDMLLAAWEHALSRLSTRIARHAAEVEPGTSAPEFLHRIAAELLVTSPEYVDEGKVWIAFLARAVVSEQLAKTLHGHYDGGHQLIADVLRMSQTSGETAADVDPELEATALLALVDGLTAHVLIGRCDNETALRALSTHLKRLCR